MDPTALLESRVPAQSPAGGLHVAPRCSSALGTGLPGTAQLLLLSRAGLVVLGGLCAGSPSRPALVCVLRLRPLFLPWGADHPLAALVTLCLCAAPPTPAPPSRRIPGIGGPTPLTAALLDALLCLQVFWVWWVLATPAGGAGRQLDPASAGFPLAPSPDEHHSQTSLPGNTPRDLGDAWPVPCPANPTALCAGASSAAPRTPPQ